MGTASQPVNSSSDRGNSGGDSGGNAGRVGGDAAGDGRDTVGVGGNAGDDAGASSVPASMGSRGAMAWFWIGGWPTRIGTRGFRVKPPKCPKAWAARCRALRLRRSAIRPIPGHLRRPGFSNCQIIQYNQRIAGLPAYSGAFRLTRFGRSALPSRDAPTRRCTITRYDSPRPPPPATPAAAPATIPRQPGPPHPRAPRREARLA